MRNKVNNLAILQARMSSTRLPGKVLEPVLGIPMIIRQIERLKASNELDHIVVATSQEASDDALAEALFSAGIDCFRGNLDDVLSRFAECASEYPTENIIRLTADCPLADPEVIDSVVLHHLSSGADYTSNTLKRTFPRGLDVECFTSESFSRLQQFELSSQEREHVTMGFYQRPDIFVLENVSDAIDRSELRWTVDYPEDLTFVREIYSKLYSDKDLFTSEDIREVISQHPELNRLESDVEGHN